VRWLCGSSVFTWAPLAGALGGVLVFVLTNGLLDQNTGARLCDDSNQRRRHGRHTGDFIFELDVRN